MKFTAIALCAALLLCACATQPKVEPFSVKLDSPSIGAGSAEMYLDGFLSIGGLKKNDVTVSYFPNENAVCLNFKIQFIDCNQFWDRDGREAFIKALEQYKEDYAQQKLAKGSKRKHQKEYGSVNGFFAWKKNAIGIQAQGFPRIDLGYVLRDRAAFFITTQQEVYYEDNIAQSRNQNSGVVRMHFSRSQAEALAALFDEDYLRSLALTPIGGSAPSKPVQTDEYSF